jgi:hypothetical protein
MNSQSANMALKRMGYKGILVAHGCWIALKIDPGFAVIVDSARSSRFRVLRRYSWVKIRCKYTRIMDQFCVQFNSITHTAM